MEPELVERTKTLGLKVYEIGRITPLEGLNVRFKDGTLLPPPTHSGFQHFEHQ